MCEPHFHIIDCLSNAGAHDFHYMNPLIRTYVHMLLILGPLDDGHSIVKSTSSNSQCFFNIIILHMYYKAHIIHTYDPG